MEAPPHPFGLHRVLDPPGALPQAALRLDNTPKALANELSIRVRALSVDSASFRQLREQQAKTGETIESQILKIVAARGKLHNPVTGSGGMLIGDVLEIGRDHPESGRLAIGQAVASLVSLTLTPLSIDRIIAVHERSERVEIEGTAILFARTLVAPLPDDIAEPVALAAFDVAGAPAGVALRAKQGETVVVIGAGKAGMLCLAAAREAVGSRGAVIAIEPFEGAAERARRLGFADRMLLLDAREPARVFEAVREATGGRMANLVVNVANVPGTEAGSVLAAKDDGAVLFFGMATSFSAAALGAEGLAKSTTLLIGNGYVPGHAELALDLLRRHPKLREAFEALAGT